MTIALSASMIRLEQMHGDIKYAGRRLRRAPAFFGILSVVLAVGIVANVLVYSAAAELLLRPFPAISNPAHLVQGASPLAYPTYIELSRAAPQARTIRGFAASRATEVGLTVPSQESVRPAQALFVSYNYFSVVGVPVIYGRDFEPADADAPNRRAVLILAHDTWRAHFAGDPQVVGRSVRLNGVPFEIIGVASRGFFGTSLESRTEVFVPLTMLSAVNPQLAALRLFTNPTMLAFTPLARVKNEFSAEQANAELNVLYSVLPLPRPPTEEPLQFRPVSETALTSDAHSRMTRLLGLFGAASGVLLLLGCLTVGHLMLIHGDSRRVEFGIRMALGATRSRLVRETLVEITLLSVIAAAMALALFGPLSAFVRALPARSPLPVQVDLRIDMDTALLAIAFTLFSVVLAGVVPAFRAAGRSEAEVVHTGYGVARTSGVRRGWRSALVVSQVALSVLLVTAAVLLADTVRNERHANVGFDPENVVVLRAQFAIAGYSKTRAEAFARELSDRLRALPDVTSVALASREPVGGNTMESRVSRSGTEQGIRVFANTVTAEYFRTLRLPVEGRSFDASDAPEVVVSRSLASRLWPGADRPNEALLVPITRDGRLVDVLHQVVGVAGDTKYASLRDESAPVVYLRRGTEVGALNVVLVRARSEVNRLVDTARSLGKQIDPNVPLEAKPLTTTLAEQSGRSRALASLMGAVGVLASMLALLGVYGLTAQVVSRRTREIALRLALGAHRQEVVRHVLRQAILPVAGGVLVGVLCWLPVAESMRALVYGVAPADWRVLTGVGLSVLVVALLASYVPARRASRIEPSAALRAE